MKIIALTSPDSGIRYRLHIQTCINAGAEVCVVAVTGWKLKLDKLIFVIQQLRKNGILSYWKKQKKLKKATILIREANRRETRVISDLGIIVSFKVNKTFNGFSNALAEYINQGKADFVLQTGAGIIPERLITSVSSPILNLHPGILPGIRGVSPQFWACYFGKSEWLGTTLHIVTKKIDAGKPLVRKKVKRMVGDKRHFAEWSREIVLAECDILTQLCKHGFSSLETLDEGGTDKSIYRSYWTTEEYNELQKAGWWIANAGK